MNLEPVNQIELEEILGRYSLSEESDSDGERLVLYIIQEFGLAGRKTFTPQDIHERFEELVKGRILRDLVEGGALEVYLDENGEDYYELSEDGKEYARNLFTNDN